MLLFEATGLLLIAPAFSHLADTSGTTAFVLLAISSAIAMVWHLIFNIAFDKLERRYHGRDVPWRATPVRILHAIAFEGGLAALTLPLVMWTTGLGLGSAIVADLGLSGAYALHAFCFTWLYDKVWTSSKQARC